MKTRRDLLTLAALAGGLPLALAQIDYSLAQPRNPEPTPACGDDHAGITPEQMEGPYYTPDSPLRTGLYEAGMAGTRLRVGGLVLGRACRPAANVLVDLWHADADGQYDNRGYRLRGHQFTDAEGRWQFETIVPGLYPGRTRHLHVKLQPPRGDILTTQLYFPDEPGNARDRIFDRRLLLRVAGDREQAIARYDFVLPVG
ncbi:MAG: intradiol ring-cleavage dioxygenase [Ferrovibrio sp.]|uniref:dioxygenase family protein n=1 Tax=Ferrovibrio sp. TaxID=1917215 RepID=UPI00263942FF|nr:intradiol ring-cleavage dioxygenase [Ferrovibrio sp.]MCW0235547.1 intradiol ring-cleavage dioxygenase [Ferrovibrio sp.]